MKPATLRKVILAIGLLSISIIGLFQLAVRWRPMDTVTVHAPNWLRTRIATDALERISLYQDSPAIKRVLRLDPLNGVAWRRLCENWDNKTLSTATRLSYCKTAASLKDSAWVERDLGDVQLQSNDGCAAFQTYQRAIKMAASLNQADSTYPWIGSAALLCGNLEDAKASFEAGLKISKTKADQNFEFNHAGLSVYYDLKNMPEKAHEECLASDPDPKDTCTCVINDNHSVGCGGSYFSNSASTH